MTTQLYLDQTGDLALLDRKAPYFKDPQAMRGNGIDEAWAPEQGSWQRTEAGEVYRGTLLEHLLLQQLTAFYDVGEHNLYRLRGADWNDALDMAADRGESVAFTCAYAGNLRTLAALLRQPGRAQPRRQSGTDGGTDGAAAPPARLRRPGRQAGTAGAVPGALPPHPERPHRAGAP